FVISPVSVIADNTVVFHFQIPACAGMTAEGLPFFPISLCGFSLPVSAHLGITGFKIMKMCQK
ncbi:TPA: hypothetical protein ACLBAZ_002202, partial [Neisseria meningitidis]